MKKIDIVAKLKEQMEIDEISGNNPYIKSALYLAKNKGFSEIVAMLLAAAANFKPNLNATSLVLYIEQFRETLSLLPALSTEEKDKLNKLFNNLKDK